MTEQEALEILDNECQDPYKVQIALKVARLALKKQIAKKLKHGVCPNCNTNNDVIIKHLGNPQAHKSVYCWNCGQKLDRSEV